MIILCHVNLLKLTKRFFMMFPFSFPISLNTLFLVELFLLLCVSLSHAFLETPKNPRFFPKYIPLTELYKPFSDFFLLFQTENFYSNSIITITEFTPIQPLRFLSENLMLVFLIHIANFLCLLLNALYLFSNPFL